MDRYDRIIHDILRKTRDDALAWRVVTGDAFARAVTNPDRVLRALEADYPLGGDHYTLLFVEKRVPRYDEFGDAYESVDRELLVLDAADREIVVSLYDGVVEREDLLRLSGLIDDHNDRARKFFAAFDATEVA